MAADAQSLRSALDCLSEPLLIVNGQNQCIFANSSFYSFLRFGPSEHGELRLEKFWPEFSEINRRLPEASSEFHLATGEVFAVKLALVEMGDSSLLVKVLAGVSKDETFLNFQAQRLETLGMLAGGVAHDFNNVLAGILGHVTYLKTVLPPAGNHCESLVAIEEGAKKASLITQQILNFSKMEIGAKPRKINLNELVVKTCRLLRGAISPEYRLEYRIPEQALYMLGVEGNLAQVMVNLVINARDAISHDGYIRITLDQVTDAERLRKAFSNTDLSSAEFGCLAVSDNGHGMSPEVIARIFEPYFSTKKDRGTGLGLATVSAIVRHFGGVIDVSSKPAAGTTMAVYFPLVQSKAEPAAAGKETPGLQGGNESILIVDDEYPVRNVLAVSLEHLGYKVAMASSGVEALEKFGGDDPRFDLVILDMLMPNLSGEKVFFKLRKLNPQLRVLLISGYSLAENIQKVTKHEGVSFIQKPFTIDDLAKRVRACLDYEFCGDSLAERV